MFNNCCDNPRKTIFDLKHDENLRIRIRRIWDFATNHLWYVPSIASYQSDPNELIDDDVFSIEVLAKIYAVLDIDSGRDVLIFDGEPIPDSVYNFFTNEICVSCSKIVIQKYKKNESIARAFLRHIRNSIAHGRFTLLDNTALFFDVDQQKQNTAIIKLDYSKLLNVAPLIEESIASSNVDFIIKAFERRGYLVEKEKNIENIRVDYLASKNGQQYLLEIKEFNASNLGQSNIVDILHQMDPIIAVCERLGIKPLLVFSKGILTHKAKTFLAQTQLLVIDKTNLQSFFGSTDEVLKLI